MTISPSDRLVILAPNWLGDAVMALPLIADVRRAWPNTSIAVAGRASVAALFDMVPAVNDAITLSGGAGLAGLTAWRGNAEALARGAFDAALLLPNSFAAAWTAWQAEVPERWGYATDWRGRLLTRAVPVPSQPGHHAEYYQALGERLGFTPGPRHAAIHIDEQITSRARQMLAEEGLPEGASFVVMAAGAAYGRAKQWLPERFAELARMLEREREMHTVLVGSRGDADVCGEISRMAGLKPGPSKVPSPDRPDSSAGSSFGSVGRAMPGPAEVPSADRPDSSAGPSFGSVSRATPGPAEVPSSDRPDSSAGSSFGSVSRATPGPSEVPSSDRPDSSAGPSFSSVSRAKRGHNRIVNICGKTDLPTLAGVLSLSHAVVANDSGAMHLAAAVGARVVAVFGATDEHRTAPLAASDDAPRPIIVTNDVWCRPCLLRECPIDHRCMSRISARQVFELI